MRNKIHVRRGRQRNGGYGEVGGGGGIKMGREGGNEADRIKRRMPWKSWNVNNEQLNTEARRNRCVPVYGSLLSTLKSWFWTSGPNNGGTRAGSSWRFGEGPGRWLTLPHPFPFHSVKLMSCFTALTIRDRLFAVVACVRRRNEMSPPLFIPHLASCRDPTPHTPTTTHTRTIHYRCPFLLASFFRRSRCNFLLSGNRFLPLKSLLMPL